MPKRITNIERIRRIDAHNLKNEIKVNKRDEAVLVRITKEFIKSCKKINNKYSDKEHLINK